MRLTIENTVNLMNFRAKKEGNSITKFLKFRNAVVLFQPPQTFFQ